jgi:hypothetical protein
VKHSFVFKFRCCGRRYEVRATEVEHPASAAASTDPSTTSVGPGQGGGLNCSRGHRSRARSVVVFLSIWLFLAWQDGVAEMFSKFFTTA